MRKSFKLLLGLLLAVLMVASVMTVGVFAEDDGAALFPLEDSGTEADPYRINDLDDLVNFSKLVNAGSTFAGEYVELTADIDLTGVVWTPIGTSNYDKAPDTEGVKMFAGNFDGGNHTITGLSSDGYVPAASETGSTEYSFGLFGYVYGANISNVKLANVDINGGTYKLDKASDSLIYSGASVGENEGIVVNGGTFVLDNVDTGVNGKPWIFNVLGANNRHVDVHGGTFNANINAQHWVFEVKVDKTLALKDNGDGTWTVVDAVAYVNNQHWASAWYTRETGYATLQEAFDACEGVKTKTVGKKVYTSEEEGVTLLGNIDLGDSIVIG